MIGANLGIGFWPEFTWGEVNHSQVRLLEIKNPICQRDILITHKRVKADTTYSESFYSFLKQYFEQK